MLVLVVYYYIASHRQHKFKGNAWATTMTNIFRKDL